MIGGLLLVKTLDQPPPPSSIRPEHRSEWRAVQWAGAGGGALGGEERLIGFVDHLSAEEAGERRPPHAG